MLLCYFPFWIQIYSKLWKSETRWPKWLMQKITKGKWIKHFLDLICIFLYPFIFAQLKSEASSLVELHCLSQNQFNIIQVVYIYHQNKFLSLMKKKCIIKIYIVKLSYCARCNDRDAQLPRKRCKFKRVRQLRVNEFYLNMCVGANFGKI